MKEQEQDESEEVTVDTKHASQDEIVASKSKKVEMEEKKESKEAVVAEETSSSSSATTTTTTTTTTRKEGKKSKKHQYKKKKEEKKKEQENGEDQYEEEETNKESEECSSAVDESKQLRLKEEKEEKKRRRKQNNLKKSRKKSKSPSSKRNDIDRAREMWTSNTNTTRSSTTTNNNAFSSSSSDDCKLIGYKYLEILKEMKVDSSPKKEELKIKAWELSIFEREMLTQECTSKAGLYYKYEGIGPNRTLLMSNYDLGNEDFTNVLQDFKKDDSTTATNTIELEVDTISRANRKLLPKLCKSIGGLEFKWGSNTLMTITKIVAISESDRIMYTTKLQDYRNDPVQTHPLEMPRNLSNVHRRFLHNLCNQLGLKSKSNGKNDSRYIQITKPLQKKKEKVGHVFPLLLLGQDADVALKRHMELFPFDERREVYHAPKPDAVHKKRKPIKEKSMHVPSVPYTPRTASSPQDSKIEKQRRALPIYAHRDGIISSIQANPVTLIIGDTGCGKSTQVPQYILESNPTTANIIVTQPRRISAMMLAQRISQEKMDVVGHLIGYQIRMESKLSAQKTRVTFMTPGVLLRKLQSAPELSQYTHVVLDEVHERDRHTEFVMICLRDILSRTTHSHLKVVLMSATMQIQELIDYWSYNTNHDRPIIPIRVPGRMYPVQQLFLEDILKVTDYMDYLPQTQHNDSTHSDALSFTLHNIQQTIKNTTTKYKCLLCWNAQYECSFDLATHVASCTGVVKGREHTLDGTLMRYRKLEQQIFKYDPFSTTMADHGGVEDKKQKHASTSDEEGVCSTTATTTTHLEPNEQQEQSHVDPVDDDDDDPTTASLLQTTNITLHNNTQSLEEEELLRRYQSTHDNNNDGDRSVINYDLILSILHYILKSSSAYDSDNNNGAILIFLPGWGEIMEFTSILQNTQPFRNSTLFKVLPLHSSISSYDQRLVFEKAGKGSNMRKIILSTNIAETSLTIEDVVYVIDIGYAKEKNYDPYLKMNTLTTVYISQSSAKQRMGRAGRVKPGICFRLYSKQRYESFRPYLESEFLRTSLEEVCLLCKLLHLAPGGEEEEDGIQAFLGKALSPPNVLSISNAINALVELEALTIHKNELTSLGYCLAKLSLEPRVGKMVLWSYLIGNNTSDPVCSMAVAMSYKSPFVFPANPDLRRNANDAMLKLSCNSESDLITIVHLLQQADDANQNHRNRKQDSGGKRQNLRSFCSDNFLNYPTIHMIMGLRKLLSQELQSLGFLDPLLQNKNQDNRHNHRQDSHADYAMLQATISAGLYPNIAYRRRKEINFTTYASTLGFNTSKAKISIGSVNAIRSEEVPLSSKCMTDYEFVLYGEIIRGASNSTFQLSQTTFLASPLSIFLLCGAKFDVIHQPEPSSDDEDDEQSRYSHLTILSIDDWIKFYTYKDIANCIYILRHRLKNVFQHFVEKRALVGKGDKHKGGGWVMSKVEEDALNTLNIVIRSAHDQICHNG